MGQLSPVVIAGSIAIDRIMRFGGRYTDVIRPDQLKSLSVSILVDDLHVAHGGGGANIAYSLALLGDNPVLLGAAGQDGAAYLEQLAGYGVDTSRVHRSKLPTATFNVITDADQNQVGGFYPGAMRESDSLSFTPWQKQNPVCLVAAHDPDGMRRQVAECARWKLRLVYDPGQQVTNVPADDLRAGVEAASLLMVNEYELGLLCAKTGWSETELKSRVPVVVMTLGKEGSVVEGAEVGKTVRVGVVKPRQVVDPTGAGDAYRAGWLYGWRRDWGWQVCAQLGATCAAYAVETAGTQGHTFTFEQVKTRYEATFGILRI